MQQVARQRTARIATTAFLCVAVSAGATEATLTPQPAPPPASISTGLLPEDPARSLVIRTCVVCHPAELLASKKRTADTWGKIITKMVDYGARASEDQQDEIYGYLTTYLLGSDTSIGAPPPPATQPAPAAPVAPPSRP